MCLVWIEMFNKYKHTLILKHNTKSWESYDHFLYWLHADMIVFWIYWHQVNVCLNYLTKPHIFHVATRNMEWQMVTLLGLALHSQTAWSRSQTSPPWVSALHLPSSLSHLLPSFHASFLTEHLYAQFCPALFFPTTSNQVVKKSHRDNDYTLV